MTAVICQVIDAFASVITLLILDDYRSYSDFVRALIEVFHMLFIAHAAGALPRLLVSRTSDGKDPRAPRIFRK